MTQYFTCYSCMYCLSNSTHESSRCYLFGEEGRSSRAVSCRYYSEKPSTDSSLLSSSGYRYRSLMASNYKTARQWKVLGYKPKAEVTGEKMHPQRYSRRTYVYFLPEEVEKIKKTIKPEHEHIFTCVGCNQGDRNGLWLFLQNKSKGSGSYLYLEKEPDNALDKYAIAVKCGGEVSGTLGYVSRKDIIRMHDMMDKSGIDSLSILSVSPNGTVKIKASSNTGETD